MKQLKVDEKLKRQHELRARLFFYFDRVIDREIDKEEEIQGAAIFDEGNTTIETIISHYDYDGLKAQLKASRDNLKRYIVENNNVSRLTANEYIRELRTEIRKKYSR